MNCCELNIVYGINRVFVKRDAFISAFLSILVYFLAFSRQACYILLPVISRREEKWGYWWWKANSKSRGAIAGWLWNRYCWRKQS